MNGMWWRRRPERPEDSDRDAVDAAELIASYSAWLDDRTRQARRRGCDLAFFDSPLRRTSDPTMPYVGWTHVFLERGASPPLGENWTVYRLGDED
jgi:hypothetical protein